MQDLKGDFIRKICSRKNFFAKTDNKLPAILFSVPFFCNLSPPIGKICFPHPLGATNCHSVNLYPLLEYDELTELLFLFHGRFDLFQLQFHRYVGFFSLFDKGIGATFGVSGNPLLFAPLHLDLAFQGVTPTKMGVTA